jgi:DNA (cytosine-5)-methyltransferase 1
MEQIHALPWNGFKVASTFSGCGGSCTGYRMAGFKVVWANEFVPAAQDSYRANMEADCILDPRDVKRVTSDEILNATGLQRGELDLFDGSPPCQAFSTAGKREKGWGKLKEYEHGAKQKNEELFFDYIRLLEGLQPKVFVAENVSGLVKGTAKGFFLEILAGLKACGYNVKAKLLDAQWLGVPQMRQRVIFVGVRNDLGLAPVHPKPLDYRYSVRDALPEIERIPKLLSGKNPSTTPSTTPSTSITTHGFDGTSDKTVYARVIHDTSGLFSQGDVTDRPCPAITIGVNSMNSGHYKVETETEKRKFTIAELKRICAFPDDFILTGSYAQQWERLGNSVPPVMMFHIASVIRDEILSKVK